VTVFGLGNPGEKYAATRHNVGFMVVDTLARRLHGRFRHAPERMVCRREFAGRDLVLVKPLLFMNESGIVVRDQIQREPDDFLVVYDDIALPFGRLRIRPRGSDGGHNGIGSIIHRLGRDSFPRLRVGVDAPAEGEDAVDWVLGAFPADQQAALPELLDRAADACITVVTQGLARAMNKYNPAPDSAPAGEE
jgi:PTH1 family peptidyl-tRNA hydrolase